MGRSVSPPAGRTLAKGGSVSSSRINNLMYKYSNFQSKGCARERIGTRYLVPGGSCPLKDPSLVVVDV